MLLLAVAVIFAVGKLLGVVDGGMLRKYDTAVIDIDSLMGCGCSLCDHTSLVVDGKGRTPRQSLGVLPFPSTTRDV